MKNSRYAALALTLAICGVLTSGSALAGQSADSTHHKKKTVAVAHKVHKKPAAEAQPQKMTVIPPISDEMEEAVTHPNVPNHDYPAGKNGEH
jgi:hypothetical protein